MSIVKRTIEERVCDGCGRCLGEARFTAEDRVTVDWHDDSGNGGVRHYHRMCLGLGRANADKPVTVDRDGHPDHVIIDGRKWALVSTGNLTEIAGGYRNPMRREAQIMALELLSLRAQRTL